MHPITIHAAKSDERTAVLVLLQAALTDVDDVGAVWDAWIAEPAGAVSVALVDEQVVGLLHFLMVTPEEAYLDHMQVVPTFGDRGIATALVQHGIQQARDHAAAVVRSSTTDADRAMQGIYVGAGFVQVGSYVPFIAATAGAIADATLEEQIHQPGPAELDRLWEWLERSNIAPLVGGLLLIGEWPAALTDDALERALAAGHVWTVDGWGELQAVVIAGPPPQHGQALPYTIRYLDGTAQGIGQLALHLRALAATQGYDLIEARPPDLLIVHDALAGAGFTRTEDATRWLFAKDLG